MGTKYIVNNLSGQTINNQQLQPYKVFTALLTQSGGKDYLNLSEGELTIGVTYLIYDLEGVVGADFTNVGAPNNNVGTYFVATGTTPIWGTNPLGFAILFYNEGAPVATVLENTIGNVWFTFGFAIQSDNLFNTAKTFLNTFNFFNNGNDTVSILTANIDDKTFSYIGYDIFDLQGVPTFFTNLPIEIRVYN